MDFDIKINNSIVRYSDIEIFLKKGQNYKAIKHLVEKTGCSETQAIEVMDDIYKMKKEQKMINKSYSYSDNKPPTPTCPKCGSTAITAGQKGYSLWTGFLGSNKTMNRCANCGHAWEPGK